MNLNINLNICLIMNEKKMYDYVKICFIELGNVKMNEVVW